MFRKLISHTAVYGLAPQVTRIASVLALPIITKDLTTIDFGVYGVVTAIAGAIAVLNTLGLKLVLTNSFFKSPHQYKWGWRQIYGFLMLWNIPYSLFLAIVLWCFVPEEASSDIYKIIILNVLPIVFFGPTAVIGNTYYQLKQMPMQIAVRSIVFGMITVFLNIYFISVLKQGYMGWFISTAISTMLSQMSFFVPINFREGIKPIFNFKWRYIKKSLKVSIPTIPHYYSTYLLDSSDRLIMKSVGITTSQIGLYNAAYTVGNFIRQAGMAAGFAVGPMLNAAYKEGNERKARDLIFVLQTLFLAGSFILAIWLKEVFQVLLKNKELQGTYGLGVIIVMAYSSRPMYFGANGKLFYIEKTTLLLKVTFIAALINVMLNLFLIPIWGISAAAWVTYISLFYMSYAGYYLKVIQNTANVKYFHVFWAILSLILTIFALYIVDSNVIFKGIISLSTTVLAGYFIFYFGRRGQYAKK